MFSEEIVSDLGFYQSWVRVGTMIVVCCLVATIVFRLIQRGISGVTHDKFKMFIYAFTIFGVLEIGIGGCGGVHACKRILRMIGDLSLEEWEEASRVSQEAALGNAITLLTIGTVISFGLAIFLIWSYVRFYKRLAKGQGASGDYWVERTGNTKKTVVGDAEQEEGEQRDDE